MSSISRFISFCFLIPAGMVISLTISGQEIVKKNIVSKIEISGNKVTKEKIILREIEIQPGDTIEATDLENVLQQTHNNLMNMSLFNFAEVNVLTDSVLFHSDEFRHIIVRIHCTERLYIWPVPILYIEERNFNEWLEHRDLSRLSWGAVVVHENFRGRRENLSLGFKTGFNDLVDLKYTNPAIDKTQSLGLGLSVNYARDHNVFYKTENNTMQLLKLENNHAITKVFFHISLIKRFGIHQSFRIYTQSNHYKFSDTLFALNPDFIEPSLISLDFLTISLLYKYDFRDYIHYPLEGYFFDCEINKHGFGIFKNDGFSIVSLKSSYRKYWKLDNRLYFAGGITTRLRLDGNKSYFFNRGLGFGNDYVRGFESYVIDGRNYYLLKSNLKYNIIQPRILTVPFVKTEKFNTIPYRFYLNIFADAGYISDSNPANINTLGNKLLFGYGAGIDFVTYYDRAYRIEISRNSKNEFSFAIQFTAPI
jgi:outer membrane protein assembly factor BamA